MIERLPAAWILVGEHDEIQRITDAVTDGHNLDHPCYPRPPGRWARTEAEANELLRRHLRTKADRLRGDLARVVDKLAALPPEAS
jgi:hypothetical protein